MPILSRIVSGFQKCHSFLCTTNMNAKNAFQKCDVITLTFFFYHCTAQDKYISLKFCMRLFVCISITYIPVFLFP